VLDVNEIVRRSPRIDRIAADPRAHLKRLHAGSDLLAIVSAAVTGLIFLVGFALALVFAATLAVVMVLAAALFAVATLAWRVRPRPARVQAVRAGHAWVTYRWDDRLR
jgi:hypothetical protein